MTQQIFNSDINNQNNNVKNAYASFSASNIAMYVFNKLAVFLTFIMSASCLIGFTVKSTGSFQYLTFIMGFAFISTLIMSILSFKIYSMTSEGLDYYLFFYGLSLSMFASMIFAIAPFEIIAHALLMTIIAFSSAAIYGYTTKRELHNIAGIATLMFINVFIISILNVFFFKSTITAILIDFAVIAISLIFVAYSTKYLESNIQSLVYSGTLGNDLSLAVKRAVTIQLISLATDFVNIFIRIAILLMRSRD